jgi:hypothetical protein
MFSNSATQADIASMDNDKLNALFQACPKRSILLIEDMYVRILILVFLTIQRLYPGDQGEKGKPGIRQ